MLSRTQRRLRHAVASALFVTSVLAFASPSTFAQESPSSVPWGALETEKSSSVLGDALKKVALDPTTYAPALIAYDATMRDWKTSQPLFRIGYRELNGRYTISGRPNDTPLGYAAGQRQILKDAVMNLEISLAHNVTSRLFERALRKRFPDRPKLVRTIAWIERIAFATILSYKLSEAHYRQAEANERLAAQLGLR
jgi:hypothetical protein